MVDKRAAKLAVLVAGSVLLVLVVGQVLRWVTRMLAWAVLAALVVLLAYVAYELYAGWAAAADETSDEAVDRSDPIEPLQEGYASGSLTDEEFESELEDLIEPSTDVDGESELERELG